MARPRPAVSAPLARRLAAPPLRSTVRNAMRLRTLLGPVLAVAVTSLGWLRWRTPWSLGILLLATALLALALTAPHAYAPLQATLERIGRYAAAAFTWIVLGLVFLLIFVPGRLLLAVLRRDPLHRRPDPHRSTYWEPLPPTADPARFRRQF